MTPGPSLLLQNFFLYFFGMCFNLAGLSIFWVLGAITPATMFAGFRQVRPGKLSSVLLTRCRGYCSIAYLAWWEGVALPTYAYQI